MINIDKCKFHHENKNRPFSVIVYRKSNASYAISYHKRVWNSKAKCREDRISEDWSFYVYRKTQTKVYHSMYGDWKKMPAKFKEIAIGMKELYEETFLLVNKLEGK